MTDDRLQRVRAVHRRWAAGDFSDASLFGEDMTMVTAVAEGDVEAGGREQIARVMGEFLSQWAHYHVVIEEERERGDRILGIGRQFGRSRSAGLEIDEEAYAVWTFAGPCAVRLRVTWDREAALAEFGEAP